MNNLKSFGNDIRAAILDLDGTMIDSFPDVVNAANLTRQKHGLPVLPYDDVIAHVGYGPEVLIRGIFPDISDTEIPARITRFIETYRELRDSSAVVFPGVREFLRGSGLRHAVLTNKMERLARAALDRFELSQYFEKISGYDTIGYRKPDGRTLAWMLGAMDIMPSQAIYIGDSLVDLETADAAGVAFVLVDTGLIGTIDTMPENIVSRLDDLLK